MKTPQAYWEETFQNITPETYDLARSRPAAPLRKFCARYLAPGDPVLDLGCGMGRNAHYLADQGYEVSGVDFAAAAVTFCQQRFARFALSGTFKQGTFDQIPFPDDSFCGIACIAALDHVPVEQARAAMEEMRRVLRPGGAILLTFDPPDQDEELLDEATVLADGTLHFVRGKQAGMLFRRYTDREIRSLLGESNILSFRSTARRDRVIVCH
jgi:ubiquinone/menaquinone biosynthesis C-methylase UbiE